MSVVRTIKSRLRARFVGAALVLVGVGVVLISTAFHGQPVVQSVSANVPVNPGARDPGDINANNSPSLARDPVAPEVLVDANRVDTPAYTCALDVSRDGGQTWTAVRVPIPAGEEPKCFTPDVTFASDGTLYMSYVTLRGTGNVPHAVWVVQSRDGGRTLSAPQRVLGPLAFQVRMATDPARPRRLYLTWLQASSTGLYRYTIPGNPIEVIRSDDGGVHWTRPARVSAPTRLRVVSPVPVVGLHGVLYVLYLDLGGDSLDYEGASGGSGGPPYQGHFSLILGRSSDAGATWQESVVDHSIVPTRRFVIFLAPFPSLAVDRRSGRIYAAFEDGRLGDADVYVWSLAPGAGAWSLPVRVNDTPLHDRTAQYLPALAVAPNGRLDVIYYDRRVDPSNKLSSVSLQSSFDEGRTFSAHVELSNRSFSSQIGAGSELGLPDLGSNLALASSDSQVLAAWTDTRAGTVASNKQDITFARAFLSSPAQLGGPARYLLRYGGLVAVLLGLAVAFGAIGRLGRPRGPVTGPGTR